MKQINSLLAMCFCAAFFLAMASCSKTGPTGPAGATGPAGPAGQTGGNGAAGAKGDPGTANVIYSAWLDATYIPIKQADENGDSVIVGYYYPANVPKLTAAIVNSGEVKVYLNIDGASDPTIISLPYYSSQLTITPFYYLQTIELDANADISTYVDGGEKIFQWRYIIIPGGTAARSSIDWNNYAAVKKYLNLKD